MDKCREEFELYMLQSGYTECALSKSNHYDCYNDTTIDAMYLAWEAGWKASRESMKAIKLPESKEIYHMAQHGMTQMIDLNDTISAITSAGYKVEE